jgi:pimeloyl-ACP methyl ester carboxylesterase
MMQFHRLIFGSGEYTVSPQSSATARGSFVTTAGSKGRDAITDTSRALPTTRCPVQSALDHPELCGPRPDLQTVSILRRLLPYTLSFLFSPGVLAEQAVGQPVSYRTVVIDGHSIFYREAGPKDAPALLLLHGFPSSSRMFEPLFSRLADRYHLVAPDYPGFGHSDAPDIAQFAYTFDHLAQVVDRFTQAVGLTRYTLYMQDYGGPVGMRLAIAHPERVAGLIVQNAVAHDSGLGPNWQTRRAFWADRAANEAALRTNLLSLETTRTRHVGSDPATERYDPDLWTDEFAFLSQPGQLRIQTELFYDYRSNVSAYPQWQAWLKQMQPRLLVVWGKYDLSFQLSEPESFRRDVPQAEIHIVDGGHFALDTAADEIAGYVRAFMH